MSASIKNWLWQKRCHVGIPVWFCHDSHLGWKSKFRSFATFVPRPSNKNIEWQNKAISAQSDLFFFLIETTLWCHIWPYLPQFCYVISIYQAKLLQIFTSLLQLFEGRKLNKEYILELRGWSYAKSKIMYKKQGVNSEECDALWWRADLIPAAGLLYNLAGKFIMAIPHPCLSLDSPKKMHLRMINSPLHCSDWSSMLCFSPRHCDNYYAVWEVWYSYSPSNRLIIFC